VSHSPTVVHASVGSTPLATAATSSGAKLKHCKETQANVRLQLVK